MVQNTLLKFLCLVKRLKKSNTMKAIIHHFVSIFSYKNMSIVLHAKFKFSTKKKSSFLF